MRHTDERNEIAASGRDNPPEKIQIECTRVGLSSLQCEATNQQAQGSDRATQRDLQAQQEMAEWAYSLLWAGVIGAFITACGVVYVAMTLNETRKATAAADKAASAALEANAGFVKASRQQLTAYVIGEIPTVFQNFRAKDPTTYRLQFQIKLKNNGQTPAFQMFNICNIRWSSEEEFAALVVAAEPTSRAVLGPGSEMFAIDALKDGEGKEVAFTNDLVQGLIQTKRTIRLKGYLTYRDIDGRLWRHDYSWQLLDPSALLANPEAEDGKWKRRSIGMYANATGNDLRMIEDPNEKPKDRP